MKQKKINIIIPIVIILSVLVISCKSKKQKEALSQVDKMLEKVEFLQKRIDSLDFEKYKQIYDTTKKYDSFFTKLPSDFEISKEEMDLMYQYGMIEKCFKKLKSNHIEPLQEELNNSKSQIENLQHDIKRNFLKDEEFAKYLHDEDSILRQIEDVLNEEINFAKFHEQQFDELHPEMIKLVKKLEEKYF